MLALILQFSNSLESLPTGEEGKGQFSEMFTARFKLFIDGQKMLISTRSKDDSPLYVCLGTKHCSQLQFAF